jgi:PAS domain S-box-containing protein
MTVRPLGRPEPWEPRGSRAEHYLASILAQAQVAILAVDPEGRIITWNPGARRLFGYAPEEMVGQTLARLDPDPDGGDVPAATLGEIALGALSTGQDREADTVCRDRSGALIDVLVSVSPVRDDRGRLFGLSVIARDVSRQRRAEQALRDAARQRDVFLSMMSHELRTPLTTIIGYTDMLLRGMGGALSPRGETYLGNVRSAGHRLLGLIEGLLDFSRLEAGEEHLEVRPVEVDGLVRRAVERVRHHAEAKNIALEVVDAGPDAGSVMADEAKMQQVLGVYLTNAIKFTPRGGRIHVVGERDPQALHMARIGVRDTGIGLSADQVARIWDRFYQVDSSLTREYGGVGLGLAVAGHLVALHGGRVWAESAGPGEGSTFWVSLPRIHPPG